MRAATLTRRNSTSSGTFGDWRSDSGFSCHTGELPWRDNQHDVSCIPAGQYLCKLVFSPHHQRYLYEMQAVPGRQCCEIHAGNWCGDTSKGLKSDVLGCIIVGSAVGFLACQMAVLNSTNTLKMLMDDMSGEDFMLTIVDSPQP